MVKSIIFFLLLSMINVFGTTYKVGPGQTYTDLGAVPWLTLSPGDTVLIYWQSSPYASKIFLRVSGTEENPIVIKGVPNINGDLPVITGKNATTNPQFNGYFSSEWTEDLGLFLIHRNVNVPPEDDENYKPSFLIFEYLELTGVKPENTFTDQNGNIRNYNRFSSAIHALESDNLTIRHCKIHDNAQGIFTNSNGDTEGYISRNTLIEYNEIWGNGNADEDGTEHNVYIQSAGTIIQYNYFGSLRAGSQGANIKDRSSGTIIRFNWLEGSARILDLVETEDAAPIIMNEPNYHDVYVYGNIIVNYLKKDPFGVNLIHFGFDNSPVEAKRGTLYFYNNTVYLEGDQEDYWYINMFDIPDDADPSTTEGTVAMYNNIIHKEGTTHLQMMRDAGTINFYKNNWITEGFSVLADDATAKYNFYTYPITGSDPGFTDASTEDFTIVDSSSCINQSGPLPSDVTTNYPLNKEYVKHANWKERILVGSSFELGAFENDQMVPVELEIFTAKLSGKAIELNWQTATEVNNYGFYIERASCCENGNAYTKGGWITLGFVEGHGNSNSPHKYSFIDNTKTITKSGKYSYRLKQTDINGDFEYSNIIEMDISIPLKFELFQNYPNPFNPTTNITFTLPVNTQIKLSVHNILGEEIATLFNGNKKAGFYTFVFNATDYSTGVYFYRLKAGNFSKTKQMILIK